MTTTPVFTGEVILAGGALIVLGGLGAGLEVGTIPAANSTLLAAIIGALAGALTMSGGRKLADKITNSNGPDATVQPDATPTPPA